MTEPTVHDIELKRRIIRRIRELAEESYRASISQDPVIYRSTLDRILRRVEKEALPE